MTDQTGGWAVFDLSGPNVQAVLEKIVGFDVDAFQSGDAIRTSIGHIGSFVLCINCERFRFLCPRSFARSFCHAVVKANRSQLAFAN